MRGRLASPVGVPRRDGCARERLPRLIAPQPERAHAGPLGGAPRGQLWRVAHVAGRTALLDTSLASSTAGRDVLSPDRSDRGGSGSVRVPSEMR